MAQAGQGVADRVLRVVTRRAGWVLFTVAVITLLSLATLVDLSTLQPRLVLDPSVDSMLPRDSEGRRFYDYVRRVFGSDETLLVALVDDDVFTAENLRRIQRMTERMEDIDGVHHVVSLANALNIRSKDGDLEIEPFIQDIPDDAEGLARIRSAALDDPIYTGNLVSHDGRAAALLIYLINMSEAEFLARGIDEQITSIAQEEAGDAEAWITGGAHVKAEMSRLMLVDLTVTVPLSVLAMALVALASFRTLRGVLIPLITVGVSLAWTLGFLTLTVGSLNMVTVAAPPILLVVGFAYAVHVVAAYYDVLRGGEPGADDPEGPVFAALRHVALPVVLTGATTAAGFVSLMTSRLAAIQEFGLFSAVGVMITTLVSLTFAPALLQQLPMPRRVRALPAYGRVDRWLEGLAAFDLRNRVPILLAAGLVALVSLWGMTRIQISTDFVRNFEADNPVRMHYEAANEQLEGSNAFFVVLETEHRDSFKEPVNLHTIRDLQEWLEAQPEIGGTTSLVDYLEVINRGFHDNDPQFLKIPESKRLVTQLLFFGGNDELENFVDSRYQTVSILVRSGAIDSGDVSALVKRVEDRVRTLPSHIKGTVTGNTVLVNKTIDDIALGQSLSLSTAFLIIFGILSLLFTSFRVGLIAMLPNILPVLAYFGILGWSGVTLNTTTGLVACLVLGIAVDDTIHLMARFNTAAKRLADENQGVIEALRTVGRPVTYTTAALCLGFLVLTLSEMRNQVQFGALSAATLALAWLVDVTFTPALAGRMRVVSLWDVISLDLGDDPQSSIPLFAGLKKTQARIAALMTSIVSYTKGHRLIEIGEQGEEMYVVIDGELGVTLPTEQGVTSLGTLRRGDVIGEVGLFHGKRTADVTALSDVRLLRLTQRNLARLRRRYPRTGAQIYANLSKVLADRLATATERAR